MSEFKEKVLSEISFAMVDDAPDLQKLYDKVAAIDEHPELNDNQKIVFDFLKNEFKRNDLQYTLWSFTEDVYERLEIGVSSLPYVKAWGKLKEKQHFEVLAAFAQWGLEQEEAG